MPRYPLLLDAGHLTLDCETPAAIALLDSLNQNCFPESFSFDLGGWTNGVCPDCALLAGYDLYLQRADPCLWHASIPSPACVCAMPFACSLSIFQTPSTWSLRLFTRLGVTPCNTDAEYRCDLPLRFAFLQPFDLALYSGGTGELCDAPPTITLTPRQTYIPFEWPALDFDSIVCEDAPDWINWTISDLWNSTYCLDCTTINGDYVLERQECASAPKCDTTFLIPYRYTFPTPICGIASFSAAIRHALNPPQGSLALTISSTSGTLAGASIDLGVPLNCVSGNHTARLWPTFGNWVGLCQAPANGPEVTVTW